jgi:predicted cupin superfamily sugar epimerase
MSDRPAALITTLGLGPHPEGGYYGEVHRSSATVDPDDGRGPRSALTTIYFLLPHGSVSRWHRVQSDEVWHFYEGAPLDLWSASPEREQLDYNRLGPLDGAQRPVWVVPAGRWQAARSTGSYTLVGCTVGPGFDFRDFTLASEQATIGSVIRARYPALAELL